MEFREDRVIFHCDCNNFYASCECLERPELRDVPMAVAGDPEYRTGIVVAKNELAKKAGVKTTDTVWQAKKKCPGIVFVPPRHRFYEKISRQVNEIYHSYTEYVEPASIDESFLDMTGASAYYGMGVKELADALRRRIREEVGITISVGVSFNRVFAKMGSDYKKPDATTVITRENFRDILWPLPVSELIFAGKATVEALNKKYIYTIGDLAKCSRENVNDWLGKGGDQLWLYANGMDSAKVRLFGEKDEVKSISHGMTFRRNLVDVNEVRTGISVLVDDIAMQLRRQNLKGSVVQVQIKTPELRTISRQTTLDHYTYLQHEIKEVAMKLVTENWNIGPLAPIRAITVGVTHLSPEDEVSEQLSLFDMGMDPVPGERSVNREKLEKIEAAVDKLRMKHGSAAITLGFQKNEDIGVGR
ncbi:MAG: DNA polymerase IV [Clostridiales bacterium]|nr:DNA polymerase IV [Clostridiales bacterium]